MDEFARTGNGKRFLSDVNSIARSLKAIAAFCEFQERQAQEDIWAALYEEDQTMYRSLKAIQKGETVHGAASMWNDRLEDFLRQLQIEYYTWKYHRCRTDGVVYGTGNLVYSSRIPEVADFEGTPEEQELCFDAARATTRKQVW